MVDSPKTASIARSAHCLRELLLCRLIEQLLDHEARQLDAVGEIEDRFAALYTHELQRRPARRCKRGSRSA